MSATSVPARTVHHGPGAAAANRTEKALLIGLFCWQHSITSDDLASLAAAGLSAEQRKLARAAGETNPPSPRSWGEVIAALSRKESHAARHPEHPLSVRSGPDRREEFIPAHLWSAGPGELQSVEQAVLAELGQGIPAVRVITVTDEAQHLEQVEDGYPDPPADAPKGWAELCALGPVEDTSKRCIHHPHRKPVTVTPDGPRCAACPPRPGEFTVDILTSPPMPAPKDWRPRKTGRTGRKDGWGLALDWAPKPHHRCSLPRKCWCGRPCAGETAEES